MNIRTYMRLAARVIAIAAFGALVACAPTTTPTFDQSFASSSRELRAMQVRQPDAPVANRSKIPDGIDGRAARETIERYERSFGSPPRAVNPFVIGVGSGSETGADR